MKKIDRVISSIMAFITVVNMSGCAKKIKLKKKNLIQQ